MPKTLEEYLNELNLKAREAAKTQYVTEADKTTNETVEYVMKPQIQKYVVPTDMWQLLLKDDTFKKTVAKGNPNYGGYPIEPGSVLEPTVIVTYRKERVEKQEKRFFLGRRRW